MKYTLEELNRKVEEVNKYGAERFAEFFSE